MSGTRGRVETPEFAQFVRRLLRAYGRRVADADEVDLAEMIQVRDEYDEVIAQAVRRQREALGWSWAQIAAVTGLTRQGAHAKWAQETEAEPSSEEPSVAA